MVGVFGAVGAFCLSSGGYLCGKDPTLGKVNTDAKCCSNSKMLGTTNIIVFVWSE